MGERSGLCTGTRYRGEFWSLYRYQVQGRGLASILVPVTGERSGHYADTRSRGIVMVRRYRDRYSFLTGTRYRGEVWPLYRYQLQGKDLASTQIPDTEGELCALYRYSHKVQGRGLGLYTGTRYRG
jgi:hypothetical protein